ncbi:MAG: hypothetical protein ACKESB_01275 [Candidatus Hodgkinia cicadicola]
MAARHTASSITAILLDLKLEALNRNMGGVRVCVPWGTEMGHRHLAATPLPPRS